MKSNYFQNFLFKIVKTNKALKQMIFSPFSFLPISVSTFLVIRTASQRTVHHPGWSLDSGPWPVHVLGDQMVVIDQVGVATMTEKHENRCSSFAIAINFRISFKIVLSIKSKTSVTFEP